jgi:hypothetical protein
MHFFFQKEKGKLKCDGGSNFNTTDNKALPPWGFPDLSYQAQGLPVIPSQPRDYLTVIPSQGIP